jgi:hypothetical protein
MVCTAITIFTWAMGVLVGFLDDAALVRDREIADVEVPGGVADTRDKEAVVALAERIRAQDLRTRARQPVPESSSPV